MIDSPDGHPRELLSGYLDDELPVEERSAVDRHLAECEDCRVELEALRRLARAVADEGVPAPPADLAARIGRRLDAGAVVTRRRFRFVVPATIAATLGAIGILVALQWKQGRLGAPAATPAPVFDESKPAGSPAQAVPSKEKSAVREDVKKEAPPIDLRQKDAADNAPAGVPGGTIGSVVGGVEGGVAGGSGAASDARRERDNLSPQAPVESVGQDQPPAAAPVLSPAPPPAAARAAMIATPAECGDRWSDSGVRGTWTVPNVVSAALVLDRVAHDVGGLGVWWGAADGRPYVLVVPRNRFEEVYFSLRARGVSGLSEPPELAAGTDCAGISIALAVGVAASAPPQ